jgi:SAM-dependent methyltransferase
MTIRRDTARGFGQDRSHETTLAGLSWLQFARQRAASSARWSSIWSFRVVRFLLDLASQNRIPVQSVLDVGATDRLHEPLARERWSGCVYKSFDIDRTNTHDYHEFGDIDQQFDLVLLLEVLEHVPPKVAVELMTQCVKACRPGGYVLASVPNVYTPGIQLEWTHIAPFHYTDLLGLLSWAGLEVVDAARLYSATRKRRLLHQYLLHPLHRALDVDYAQSVVALGRKAQ